MGITSVSTFELQVLMLLCVANSMYASCSWGISAVFIIPVRISNRVLKTRSTDDSLNICDPIYGQRRCVTDPASRCEARLIRRMACMGIEA